MSDLISRADVIDMVLTYFVPRSHTGERGEYEEDFVRTIFNALPSAEAEWIPVSERLPNEDGEYLVFYEGAIIGSHIDIMWYGEPLMPNVDVSGKHFYRSDGEWGDIIYDEVIAWMPLPKPYREESEVEE